MTNKSKSAKLPQLASGQCPVCGSRNSLVHFEGEAFPIKVGKLSDTVNHLAGDRCSSCDEIFFDDSSAQKFADAGDALVVKTRKAEGAKLRKARLTLGLSQAEAGLLAGGGHNGFSRYENGLALPVSAVSNLFQLLQKHPQLVAELPGVTVRLLPKNVAASTSKHGYVRINGKHVVIEVHDVSKVQRGIVKSKSAVDLGHLVAAKSTKNRSEQLKPAAKAPARKTAPRRSA